SSSSWCRTTASASTSTRPRRRAPTSRSAPSSWASRSPPGREPSRMSMSAAAPSRMSWRLNPSATLTVAVALLLAGLSMALYNENLAAQQRLREVTVQAGILAGSVAAALDFDDRATTREYVESFRANPDLDAAGVYDARRA